MLLHKIELHMRRTKMSPTRFGRNALGDPNFVQNLREGREPRSATRRKVTDYIEANSHEGGEEL